MGLMGIVPLLVVGLIVWLVIEATRRRDRDEGRPVTYASGPPAQGPDRSGAGGRFESRADGAGGSRALAILEERYARGEIEREEYLRRRADLAG